MEDYRRYLTEEGHPQRVVDLARQIDRAEARMRELVEAVEAIDLYFQSGNHIQVERATIPAEEWERVKAAIEAAKAEWST